MRCFIYTSVITMSLMGYLPCPARASNNQIPGRPIEPAASGSSTSATANSTSATAPSTATTSVTSKEGDEDEITGTIKGKVTTADGQPAPSVTIQLKRTHKSILTDEEGTFTLRNLRPGNYEIEISLAGYATTTQTIIVEQHKVSNIAIQLKVSERQLQEVVVTGGQN